MVLSKAGFAFGTMLGRTAMDGMAQPTFFNEPRLLALAEIAVLTKAVLADPSRGGQQIRGLASLNEAGPMQLTFFDNLKYADQLASTRAGACLVGARFETRVPSHVVTLRTAQPFRAFVSVARELYSDALRPRSWCGNNGVSPSAVIDPTAHLEDGVIVDPLAVIGPDVEIGAGTVIGSGAVIGASVRIGRDCNVGPGSSIQFALIGNHVLIHPGCHIGQDGFGFVSAADGHTKVPQTGRVVVQHHVEIGAGSTIDRGSLRDTVIGEGTKIDNQVQIGHNVTIGRHCLIAGLCGLAGSLSLGDNVVLGAKVGLNNHIHIGEGAQVAAMSGVMDSIPANARWGGIIAKPTKQWFREVLALQRLAQSGTSRQRSDGRGSKDEGRE